MRLREAHGPGQDPKLADYRPRRSDSDVDRETVLRALEQAELSDRRSAAQQRADRDGFTGNDRAELLREWAQLDADVVADDQDRRREEQQRDQ